MNGEFPQQQPVHWPNRLPKHFRHPKSLAVHDDNMYAPVIVMSFSSGDHDSSRRKHPMPSTLEQRWSADLRTLYGTSMRRFSLLDLERVVGRGATPIVRIFVAQCKKKNVATACDTAVNVAISFGSPSCPVDPADFHLTHLSLRCSLCFLRLQTGTNRAGSSEILSWCVSCLVYCVVPLRRYGIGCRTVCTRCSHITRTQSDLLNCPRRSLL